MDEQRTQMYVGLIERLLGCTPGEKEALLKTNAGLVDAGLVAEMGQYADWLESQGNSNAGRMRQFAAQLAQSLGLGEESPSSSSSDDAAAFALEIMQLIVQIQSDQAQVYEFFRANVGRLNEDLLRALPEVFAQLIQEVDQFAQLVQEVDQSSVAYVFYVFGNLIQQFPLGSRGLNLEMAIAAYEQSLQVITRETMPVEWAQSMINLAIAYSKRIRGDRAQNIEEAIAAYEQSLQVITCEAMPVEWAQSMVNLATAYSNRIRGDRAQNIEKAIATYEQSLQVRTREAMPREWADSIINLAIAYSKRIRGDRAQNIEEAIAAYEQSLQVMTREAMPVEWAQSMMNLAIAYNNRIRGDQTQNIEEAIAAYEQSLQVITRETMPVEWAQSMVNLATAYSNRIRGDQTQNIEEAIAAYEQSLQVMTREAMPVEWAQSMVNLAIAYSKRIRGDRAQNIEEAIAAYEQSLQVMTREAMPVEWAQSMMNLAIAYNNRIRGDRAQNIEEAIAAYEQSLQVMTRDAIPVKWAQSMMNLAGAYSDRIQGDRAQNIEEAISAYQDSLKIFTPELLPNDCRRSARSLANLLSDQQRWQEAELIYQKALEAAETLYQNATLLDSKSAELAETADLPRRAAYALARMGDLQQAVETLEQGRARGLSESLDRDKADLTQLQQTNPNFYSQYQAVTLQLRDLESQQRDLATSDQRHSLTPIELRDTAIALRQQLTGILQNIRQVPGYEQFLALPTFADVQTAVQANHPLVYLVPTPAGSLALIVTPSTVESVWLDALNATQLIDLLNQTWFSAYNQSRTNRQGWYDAIDTTTRQLWDALMGPLVQKLQDLGFDHITLIPTGYLSFLPLHAAWTKDDSRPNKRRYALDDLYITYAPNAKSLTAAQEIVKTLADSAQARSILAIDNPRQDLPNSEREIQAAIATFPQSILLRHEQATVAEVRSKLPTVAIAHFSCHGTANLTKPLNSGMLMSDGLLTLKDIFALNLADNDGLRLAILSACETGMIGIENADEAISLPTGLLQAGVAAVIASLWSVSDLSTMLLLTRFYDLWRIEDLEMNQALHQAQQWLRDTTNREKAAYFKVLLPEPVGVQAPVAIAQFLYQSLLLKRPHERDFAHPFHWAAFSYTGV